MVRPIKTTDIEGQRNRVTGIKVNNSRKKRKRFRPSTKQVFITIVLLLLFMGSGIGYVWSNFEGTQIGYDLSRLQKEELRLKELNRKLKVELATLKSPQYLEEASKKLGLSEASPEQIFIVK